MIPKNLRAYAGSLTGYTELRAHENCRSRIMLVNGSMTANSSSTSSGISARVLVGGSWGMASSPSFEDAAIRDTLRDAAGNAAFLAANEKKQPLNLASGMGHGEFDYSAKRPALSTREAVERMMAIDDYIAKHCPGLISRAVVLSAISTEKTLVTSDGAWAYTNVPNPTIYLNMSAESASSGPVELFEAFEPLNAEGVIETELSLMLADESAQHAFIERLYERIMQKKDGVRPEAGLKECILDPRLAGMLAHEAIGHTTEADIVLAGSVAGSCMGKMVADPLISIVDYAHTAFGKRCPVPVHVDDEGVLAEDADIIRNGQLVGFLHSKATAAQMNMKPQGNARGFAFNDEPLIRMRNTAILPGKSKLEDMIASIEDGYYLGESGNGQADSTSEFMFGITRGYEIKHGKLGRALLDTTVSGVAFDMLKTVTMLSDDMVWVASGMCGKKQPMKVGMGGPAIKCKITVGGQ